MLVGMFLAGVAFVIAGFLEMKIQVRLSALTYGFYLDSIDFLYTMADPGPGYSIDILRGYSSITSIL